MGLSAELESPRYALLSKINKGLMIDFSGSLGPENFVEFFVLKFTAVKGHMYFKFQFRD